MTDLPVGKENGNILREEAKLAVCSLSEFKFSLGSRRNELKFYIYFLLNYESKTSLSGVERVIYVSVFKKG